MQFSIVLLSQLRSIKSFRLDAEYYHPSAIEYEKKIVQVFNGQSIKSIGCKVVSGPFGSSLKSESYLNKGIPFIRISDLRNFLISNKKLIYISEENNKRLSSSMLNVGDIVLSKVANIGVTSIVTSDIGICNISENNIGIRMPKGMSCQNKSFIVTYLNSIPGQNQILRARSGNVQPKLNVIDIEEVKIPDVSNDLAQLVHNNFERSKNLKQALEIKYQQAQDLLLAELGLGDWQPKHQLWCEKDYSDTVVAGRIDAEYYQPKYDEIINAITEYSITNYSTPPPTLGDLATIKKSIEVGSSEYLNEGIPFIRVSNINPFEITEEKYISEELYNQIITHQPKKGEILLSKDATPGIAFHLDKTPKKMIPSGGILRLKLKTDNINGEYLTLVLNSLLTKEQANRDVGGSVIMHWRPEQVSRVVIPILPKDKQLEIQEKVIESFELRARSKKLLDNAKLAVEMAIKQDETAAIQFLNSAT